MDEQRAMITAVVLAGGLGTRLRSVVSDRPKVLAPVAGRPFLAYLLDQLADAGFEQVILCTGYLGEQVRRAFGERFRRLHLRYSNEPEPLGTAGALRNALPLIDSDHVLVLNGDSYGDVNLPAFVQWHASKGARVSMVLGQVSDSSRFGSVECQADDRVRSFLEKGHSGPAWINCGVYLISRDLLATIPEGVVSIERQCFPSWIGSGFFGYRGARGLIDIGTAASFAEAQQFLARHSDGNGGVRRCVLLDRDGTLNFERHYLCEPAQLELLPGAVSGLKKLRDLGLSLVLVTNQSAVGRGLLSAAQLERVHDRLRRMLGDADLGLDGIYCCPHTPEDQCPCRKPKPGLVCRAALDLGFNPREAFMIGDSGCDMNLGRSVGATTLLVRTGYGRQTEVNRGAADYVVDSLDGAADVIANLLSLPMPKQTGHTWEEGGEIAKAS